LAFAQKGEMCLLLGRSAEAERNFTTALQLQPGLKVEIEKRIAEIKKLIARKP